MIANKQCTTPYHFSDGRFPPVAEHSGGSYFSKTGNILIGGMDSGPAAGYMKSTPPSFHSPARSTNTDVILTLLWTKLQSILTKLSVFCNSCTLCIKKYLSINILRQIHSCLLYHLKKFRCRCWSKWNRFCSWLHLIYLFNIHNMWKKIMYNTRLSHIHLIRAFWKHDQIHSTSHGHIIFKNLWQFHGPYYHIPLSQQCKCRTDFLHSHTQQIPVKHHIPIFSIPPVLFSLIPITVTQL